MNGLVVTQATGDSDPHVVIATLLHDAVEDQEVSIIAVVPASAVATVVARRGAQQLNLLKIKYD